MNAAAIPEIGILLRERTLLGTAHGLTDLFHFANREAGARAGSEAPLLRLSHFAEVEGRIVRRDDPAGADGGVPAFVIVPPRETIPLGMEAHDGAAAWLLRQHEAGAVLASVCGGAFLMARTGLLDGRSATTHWACAEALARDYPAVRVAADRMLIDEGDVITAGGMLAWADLGLLIVERLLGRAAMVDTARFMMIDPPGRQQRPYRPFRPRRDHGDQAVARAQALLHRPEAAAVAVTDLAASAGLAPRTFVRRFHRATGLRPGDYAQRLRIEAARHRLETTAQQIGEIAYGVGYSDPASFRKIFARITGLSPGDYRKRFGPAGG
jgi:transcriptional regulator GlxA family with amidase domain